MSPSLKSGNWMIFGGGHDCRIYGIILFLEYFILILDRKIKAFSISFLKSTNIFLINYFVFAKIRATNAFSCSYFDKIQKS